MASKCPFKPNELEVVKHLAEGRQAAEVAFRMKITVGMVRNYTKLATRVSGGKNTTGTVAKALREGWIK